MVNTDYSNVKDRCLCGVHVHTATKIIAWISIICTLLGVVFYAGFWVVFWAFFSSSSQKNAGKNQILDIYTSIGYAISTVVLSLIALGIYVLLLYGVTRKRPGFYWPYLILVGIGIVFSVIYVIGLTFGIIALLVGLISSSSIHGAPVVALILADVIVILMLAISIYFCFIIPNRSRQLMEAERFSPTRVSPNNKIRVIPIRNDF